MLHQDIYCSQCRNTVLNLLPTGCMVDHEDVLKGLKKNGFHKIPRFFSPDEVKLFMDEFWLQMSAFGVDPDKPESIAENWPKDADGNNDGDVEGGFGFLKCFWKTSSQWYIRHHPKLYALAAKLLGKPNLYALPDVMKAHLPNGKVWNLPSMSRLMTLFFSFFQNLKMYYFLSCLIPVTGILPSYRLQLFST